MWYGHHRWDFEIRENSFEWMKGCIYIFFYFSGDTRWPVCPHESLITVKENFMNH